MAHQWWAHQEIPALMQGGTMLTESFAEYSSLMVMKSDPKSNDMKMKNFLKYDFDRYLRGRTAEREKEVPLYRVEEQDYIHYGKGSVIMYALQDYLSADTVNASLRRFLERYRYAEPPYPTSLDYLSYLEPSIPDSLRPMATDWIKHITLYDLRLLDASAVKTENGMYEVTLEVEAHKFYADSIGNESPAPLHDWVDIGLYNNSDEKRLSGRKRVKLEGEKARYTILTDSLPAKAAVDPRRMLIERVITDNSKSVSQKW
jgi:aminopeptidase N